MSSIVSHRGRCELSLSFLSSSNFLHTKHTYELEGALFHAPRPLRETRSGQCLYTTFCLLSSNISGSILALRSALYEPKRTPFVSYRLPFLLRYNSPFSYCLPQGGYGLLISVLALVRVFTNQFDLIYKEL